MAATAPAGDAPAIVTRGLRKTYRTRRGKRRVAVEGLDLTVPRGGVHGFLGPNGSGKTTSIRMLLGLARADAGTMEIFGTPVPARLPDVVARVGAIVEQPKFFPAFTGRKNLTLLAAAIGVPSQEVGRVLETVGLGERADDRFKSYSLGMKQRLAIAATLLKDPDLLIFDEPTNGLDPAGIREIRHTMRGLADQGKTVLVSSHILAEVQLVADTVSIIGHGRLLASGRVEDLVGGAAGHVRVGVDEADRAAGVLEASGWTVRRESPHLLVEGVDDAAAITRALAAEMLFVRELVPVKADLEQVFLELTSGVDSAGGDVHPEEPRHAAPPDGTGTAARQGSTDDTTTEDAR
ncbi:ATP-binding cassette domain-containing protein [Luteimicrobium subarcticum]|uniref:ABC-2 type transport system ATP-binding protein n=1 Tax=Luteimicrobium subarcticum TaxID=620910 RepID=A0A2M8WQM7_9MICO|nr:ATP-binding cassette domain-containing protein [Luteimicrobium subarcticum]PJI93217.1 ABC-2 type transport system ATP-binding protein [Luteimicrobium subarcticum]